MVTDVRLEELIRQFGRTHAQASWDAGLAAIARIEAIVGDHEIDCAFERVDGYLHAPHGEASPKDADAFRNEAGVASELGFDATFASDVPFIGGPGIRFDNQARFHPRKYAAGLLAAIHAKGGRDL